jgi:hypothetical protein
LVISVISGVVCFAVGGVTAVNSGTFRFPPLIGVGMGIIFFGFISIGVGCFIINSGPVSRMRQVIAEESMKYSSRSPTPCR